jgi:hypothetical protein
MHHTIEMSDQTTHLTIGEISNFLDEISVDPVSRYHRKCLFFAGIVFENCPDVDGVTS